MRLRGFEVVGFRFVPWCIVRGSRWRFVIALIEGMEWRDNCVGNREKGIFV